jgi:hypothetical protein
MFFHIFQGTIYDTFMIQELLAGKGFGVQSQMTWLIPDDFHRIETTRKGSKMFPGFFSL